MTKSERGFTGLLEGIPIAFEQHFDGSVTLCREIVEQILEDETAPGWLKVMLGANEQRMILAAKSVPQMPDDFLGWTDDKGRILS